MKKRNMTGERFGLLLVIKEGPQKTVGKKRKITRSSWVCICDCGKEVIVLSCNLRAKNGTSSCGCKCKSTKKYNYTDLTGQEFGLLTVISKSSKMTKTRGCVWICECQCGKTCEVPTNSLTSTNKKTCGDRIHTTNNSLNLRINRYEEIPISHINAIKNNAIKRNLVFNLTPEYLWNLFLRQDRKCSLTGIQLKFTQETDSCRTKSKSTTASLDRIDSSLGYIDGNVRWVHKRLNIMKGDMDDKEMIEYCRMVFLNSLSPEKIERPTFDEYFINLAFNVSLRSDDPNIKHGAIIVSNQNHIIGTGYNATIKNSNQKKIPLYDRDKKRLWMIHAEENAILNSTFNPLTINGATLYVTGLPCVNCLQRIINFGITKVVYADRQGSILENEDSTKMRQELISMSSLKMNKIDISNIWIKRNYPSPFIG